MPSHCRRCCQPRATATQVDNHRLSGNRLVITHVVSEFYEQELKRMRDFKDNSMDLRVQLLKWRQLPDFVFEKVRATPRGHGGGRVV